MKALIKFYNTDELRDTYIDIPEHFVEMYYLAKEYEQLEYDMYYAVNCDEYTEAIKKYFNDKYMQNRDKFDVYAEKLSNYINDLFPNVSTERTIEYTIYVNDKSILCDCI